MSTSAPSPAPRSRASDPNGALSSPVPDSSETPTIDSAITARLLLAFSFDPHEPGTVAILLDEERQAIAAINVAGAVAPDAIHDVVAFICQSVSTTPTVRAVVIASQRSAYPVNAADIDRWYACAAECERHDLTLVEWFVVTGTSFVGLRDATGSPPQWRRPRRSS